MPWAGFRAGVDFQQQALPALAARLQEQLGDRQWELPVRRVVAIGIGASHAALDTFAHCLDGHGIPVTLRTGADGPGPIDPEAWYVGVSQSGRSAEVVAALREVPAQRRIAVVNRTDSPVGALATHLLSLGNLPDSRVSTIGYTGTVLALVALAERFAGKPPRPLPLPDLGAFAHQCQAWAGEVGPLLRAARATDLIGSGSSRGIVAAGALLLREGALLPAGGYDTRSYLHGYMDCASAQTAHLVVDQGREEVLLRQLREAGARVIRLGGPAGEDSHALPLPARGPAGVSIAIAVALQHLVLEHARATGNHPEDSVFERLDTKVSS